MSRNCLFLATSEEALAKVIGLTLLWERGFVEPIVPPARPYPVLAQQVIALCLQSGNKGRNTWHEHLPAFLDSASIGSDDRTRLVDEMIARRYVAADDGLLGMGAAAEQAFGHRHWMALFSVFDSPPMFTVLHGRIELGSVHELSFRAKPKNGPTVLSLGGRSWQVRHIDWARKLAYVEPSGRIGRSRWLGGGQGLHHAMCQSIKRGLGGVVPKVDLSTRAVDALAVLADAHDWVEDDATTLVTTESGTSWWTFGGGLLNAALAARFAGSLAGATHDSFAVHFGQGVDALEAGRAIGALRDADPDDMVPPLDDDSFREMKFAECVPPELMSSLILARYSCRDAWCGVKSQQVKQVRVRQ